MRDTVTQETRNRYLSEIQDLRDRLKLYEGSEGIDKDIPIPPRQSCKSEPYKILEKLLPGDSTLIKKPRKTVQNAVTRYKQRTGKDFTTRAMSNGVRVWRTA